MDVHLGADPLEQSFDVIGGPRPIFGIVRADLGHEDGGDRRVLLFLAFLGDGRHGQGRHAFR